MNLKMLLERKGGFDKEVKDGEDRQEALTNCHVQLQEMRVLFTPEQWNELVAEVQRSLAETKVPSVSTVTHNPGPVTVVASARENALNRFIARCEYIAGTTTANDPAIPAFFAELEADGVPFLIYNFDATRKVYPAHHAKVLSNTLGKIKIQKLKAVHDILKAECEGKTVYYADNRPPMRSFFAFKEYDKKGKVKFIKPRDDAKLADFGDSRVSFRSADEGDFNCAARLRCFFMHFPEGMEEAEEL